MPIGIPNRLPAPKLLGDRVYVRLKHLILSNHLKPGQKLSDRELASELKVSRTPVQKALTRLERDGLITNRARRGYVVADLDAKEVADLYDLREILEVCAIRLAMERVTASDLEELRGVLRRLGEFSKDPSRRSDEVRLGLSVHTVIARVSGNAFLYDTMLRLLERMWPFVWIETLYEDPDTAEATRSEHRALVSLIEAKQPDEAETVLRRHLRAAKEHITRILKAREDFYRQAPVPPPDEVLSRGV